MHVRENLKSTSIMDPAPAQRQHVLFTVGPAYGHIIPLLELAKKVSQYHDVTFAVSSMTVPRLTSREIIKPSDQITFYPLQDGLVVDLDDPGNQAAMQEFFIVVDRTMTHLFSHIPLKNTITTADTLTDLPPVDVVIADNTCASATPVCFQRGIPCYLVSAMNAMALRLLTSTFDETWPTVADAEADPFLREPKGDVRPPIGEGMKACWLPVRKAAAVATSHILNTSRELEQEEVRAIENDPRFGGAKVYCVGPLLPEKTDPGSHLAVEEKVSGWLDRQDANSVVYISFGSFGTPSAEQLVIIARALLAVGKPVIWSLRDKYWESLPSVITANIPGQLDDPGSQFVVLNWAPQKLILSHKSTAVFISHCGWNSTLESLSCGKPLVAWPMFADQLVNGELTERLGAGILIPDTGILCRRIIPEREITDALISVGGWCTGNCVKSRQAEAAEKLGIQLRTAWLPGGSSSSEFLKLIKFTDHTERLAG